MVTRRMSGGATGVMPPAAERIGPRYLRKALMLLIAAGVLGLTAVTAAAFWPAGDSNTGAQLVARSPAAVAAVAVAPAGHEIAVFIVAGEEQAEQVRSAVRELNLVRAAQGLLEITPQFVIKGSDAEVAALQTYTDANAIRSAQGLPAIRVEDLTGLH